MVFINGTCFLTGLLLRDSSTASISRCSFSNPLCTICMHGSASTAQPIGCMLPVATGNHVLNTTRMYMCICY